MHESKHEKNKLGHEMTLTKTKLICNRLSKKHNVKVRNNDSEIVTFSSCSGSNEFISNKIE